jgi:hypothetical protein
MSTMRGEETDRQVEERWQLSPQGEQLVGNMLRILAESQRQAVACPYDKTLGIYCGIGGTLQNPLSLYRCGSGHIFASHPEHALSALLHPTSVETQLTS